MNQAVIFLSLRFKSNVFFSTRVSLFYPLIRFILVITSFISILHLYAGSCFMYISEISRTHRTRRKVLRDFRAYTPTIYANLFACRAINNTNHDTIFVYKETSK